MPSDKEGISMAQEQLLNESDILLLKLKQLQKADELYASLFIQSKVTPAMDSVDTKISTEEAKFKNVIDSFNQKKDSYSGRDKDLFQKMNDYFEQSFESRRSIGNIRYALAEGNFNLDDNQQKWLKLNSDLIAKNNRIEELQNSLNSKNEKAASVAALSNSSETVSLKATLQLQRSENENLKNKINSLNNTISGLQSNLAKKGNSVANNSENISSSNSKKVEILNDQIELANINCNLIRADVQQIISNSKQRQKLLSDALANLNNLSKSNNPEIKNEVNIKLKELQRIAETVRD
ncbi:MAG: hypothetical protein ABI185_04385 [Ginsengibacter sp.]